MALEGRPARYCEHRLSASSPLPRELEELERLCALERFAYAVGGTRAASAKTHAWRREGMKASSDLAFRGLLEFR